VLGVTNLITLSASPVPSDVADRINCAFQRNAIIDESSVRVSVTGHTVSLDGAIGSLRAMDEALDIAWNAPGVTEVANNLVVLP
jgi:osmotically-inducible protein OsmY